MGDSVHTMKDHRCGGRASAYKMDRGYCTMINKHNSAGRVADWRRQMQTTSTVVSHRAGRVDGSAIWGPDLPGRWDLDKATRC